MSKLKKRCIVAGSVALHLTMLFMLIFVPQFIAKKRNTQRSINFVPSSEVEKLLNPAAPVTQPQQLSPKPVQKKIEPLKHKPKSQKRIVQRPRPKPKAVQKKVEPLKPKPKIKVNLTPVNSRPDSKQVEQNERARAEAARKKQAQDKRNEQTLNNIRSQLSDSTEVIVSQGNLKADYQAMIERTYRQAWVSHQIIGGNPVVKIKITVRRDGAVIGHSIVKNSGFKEADLAVAKVIERVRKFEPFYAGMKGRQQTFDINFVATYYK
jgi:TonB family protein